MKSGRVSKSEWDKITQIAIDIVNANMNDDEILEDSLKKKIIDELDKLAVKYGDNCRILSTKADYTDDASESIALLEKSYDLAEKENDVLDKVLISASLAEQYWEDFCNSEKTKEWIKVLEVCLLACPDSYGQAVFDRLRNQIPPIA